MIFNSYTGLQYCLREGAILNTHIGNYLQVDDLKCFFVILICFRLKMFLVVELCRNPNVDEGAEQHHCRQNFLLCNVKENNNNN